MTAMTTPQQEEREARRKHREMQRLARQKREVDEKRRRERARADLKELRRRLVDVGRDIRRVDREYERCMGTREMRGLESIGNRLRGLIETEKKIVKRIEEVE